MQHKSKTMHTRTIVMAVADTSSPILFPPLVIFVLQISNILLHILTGNCFSFVSEQSICQITTAAATFKTVCTLPT